MLLEKVVQFIEKFPSSEEKEKNDVFQNRDKNSNKNNRFRVV